MTHAPVSVAYIPWSRVQDFLKGEEGRPDAPYKFVCQGTPSNQEGKLAFPLWNSYSAVIRCVCNTSRNFTSGSTKNQQKSVGRGCYLGRVDLDTMHLTRFC
jgi:hypothetical protein